jgi:uncharacterized protein (UPF0264 family)
MRLLVSVRSPDEVDAAIAGGADIIDAKEPGRGSLGPVAADTFAEILQRVPPHQEVSAALGDWPDVRNLRSTITNLPLIPRPAPVYLKLGFAGVSDLEQIRAILEAACAAAAELPDSPSIVAVAYADSAPAGTASVESTCRVAAEAGAAGVLVDTRSKSPGHLFDWVAPGRLRQLMADARGAGLLTAVAGGLAAEQLDTVRWTEPDVVGFRGAACVGGRMGRVSQSRVRVLRDRLRPPSSAFIQAATLPD